MGQAVADVDGDGKDEVVAVGYPIYALTLISHPSEATGTATWTEDKLTTIKYRWDLSHKGDSVAQFWGCYAADINGNGRDELFAGGFYGENVVAVEYNGSGEINDGANYDVMQYYGGEEESIWEWETITISDSAGVIDTSYSKITCFPLDSIFRQSILTLPCERISPIDSELRRLLTSFPLAISKEG